MRGAGDLVPLVPEILPGVQYTIELFLSQLLRKLALRFADDLDPATFEISSSSQYTSGQGVPAVTKGWAAPGRKGSSDSWERHLL